MFPGVGIIRKVVCFWVLVGFNDVVGRTMWLSGFCRLAFWMCATLCGLFWLMVSL